MTRYYTKEDYLTTLNGSPPSPSHEKTDTLFKQSKTPNVFAKAKTLGVYFSIHGAHRVSQNQPRRRP